MKSLALKATHNTCNDLRALMASPLGACRGSTPVMPWIRGVILSQANSSKLFVSYTRPGHPPKPWPVTRLRGSPRQAALSPRTPPKDNE